MNPASTEYVLVCRPISEEERVTASDMQLCPPVGAQHFQVRTMQARLQPSSGSPENELKSVNAEYAAALWTVGFSTVVGLYLLSAHAGAVLSLIRR